MGVIKRGILGGFSGKVANVVGSSWKGIAVMKSLPLSVANPRTASQTLQRGKFTNVGQFGSDILVSCIKPLRDRFAQQQSGYNTFISKNIDVFNQTELVDHADLSISEGNLTPVENLAFDGNVATNSLNLSWDDNSAVGNASTDDELFVAVFNKTKGYTEGFATGIRRVNSGTIVSLQNELDAGDDVHIWTAFRKPDGTIVSNTIWEQEFMP